MLRCCVATCGIRGSPAGCTQRLRCLLQGLSRMKLLDLHLPSGTDANSIDSGAPKAKFPDRAGLCSPRSQRAQLRSKIQGFVVALFSKSGH